MGQARAMAPGRGDRLEQQRLALALARMAEGDPEGLDELYRATSARLFGLALRILCDRPSAEEVLDEVYAQVWAQAGNYDPARSGVMAWLGVQARCRAIDRLRVRARVNEHERALEAGEDFALAAEGPLEHSAATESASRVRGALARLPGEQRRLLEAAFFGGLTHTEIAAAAGQPLGTVKTRIRAGLEALRRALAPLEEELAS